MNKTLYRYTYSPNDKPFFIVQTEWSNKLDAEYFDDLKLVKIWKIEEKTVFLENV